MRLKLEDIGRMAGVSRSTVSRVINDEPNVSPEARARVDEVIRRTGFTPHAAARSLVSRRSGILGLVIPSRVHDLFEDPYFARLIRDVTVAGNTAGTTLSLFLFQTEEEEREIYPRVVESGFVDGVLITATRIGDPLLTRMRASSMPIVMIGRPDTDGVSYVDVDNRGGARRVAEHLVDLGRQRIAMIAAPANTTTGADRHLGFVDGLTERGVVADPELRVVGDYSEASGYEGMKSLLAERPDAVFAASDAMAIGAMRAIREAGLAIPDDIAVAGFDGFTASESTDPPLTTVRQPVDATAQHAVRLLNRLIDGEIHEPTAEVVPVELLPRRSTAAT